MDEKELKKLIERGETETAEFKGSLGLKDEIGEEVSAFSNSKGGLVFVGVNDKKEVIGVQIGKKTLSDLANYIKTHTDNHVFPKISVEEIEDKPVMVLGIKESGEKPVFFKGKAYGRIGNSTHKLSASEIRTLAKESRENFYWDGQICKEALISDINEDKIKWFLRKAKHERNFDVGEETPVNETLERLELMKDGKLTNAAVLLFRKNPQKFFLQAETRCARFKGTEPLEFIDMKVFGGNVFDQRDNAIEFVKEHIKLHAKIVEAERAEKWEYPIDAVREAVTNAICHRDYGISSNVQIRIFDDRIEIWNPGTLLNGLTIEKLKGKHESILRNPLIGKCFFLIKFVEQWGTGTNRIIKETINHGLPEPIFEDTQSSFILIFRKYKISDEMLAELNERQRKAIDYLRAYGKITNKEYMQVNPNITVRTAFNDLSGMVEKGIIKAAGEKKYRYYTLA